MPHEENNLRDAFYVASSSDQDLILILISI